ncbi:hypothetical protein F4820DRAFT_421773 [Hypoxylon rubiginosum]|uniref:Uncharacterized protein n=1 Tax=Hypoxylon rubiginosum TaxID=110542 RepID=A0ACB9YZS5_9PEZI|nr:hypothetical protein F4820DRAFT_421773 [Hypoxylon rubiginosum]
MPGSFYPFPVWIITWASLITLATIYRLQATSLKPTSLPGFRLNPGAGGREQPVYRVRHRSGLVRENLLCT